MVNFVFLNFIQNQVFRNIVVYFNNPFVILFSMYMIYTAGTDSAPISHNRQNLSEPIVNRTCQFGDLNPSPHNMHTKYEALILKFKSIV